MYKIKKIVPIFNQILVTKNMYATSHIANTNLIDTAKSNTIKEYQTVLAVSKAVEARGDIKVGDTVFINPKRYMTMKHTNGKLDNGLQQDNMVATYEIPTFDVYDRKDGSCEECMLIGDNDVYFIADGEEFDENAPVGNELLLN